LKFSPPLQPARLIKRYKRFLADVRKPDGAVITIHCPNTGSMTNCQQDNSRIWYSTSNNPKRKYAHTWEFVEFDEAQLVGINTNRANSLVKEAIERGKISELVNYQQIRTEVPYGKQRSRIDLLLQGHDQSPDCYVEVKNVSLGRGGGLGVFPDAVTTRGHKHLQELLQMCADGHRAVLFFCVQHTGIQWVEPADDIDPRYGELLRQAAAGGVEILAWGAAIDPEGESTIELDRNLPVVLP